MTRVVLVLVLVLVLAPTRIASADRDVAQAEVLFRQGRELIAAGKIPEACAAFDASQKLDPAIATLLNLGDCREQDGKLATAWGLFLEAERGSRTASDDFTRGMHQVAVERAAKIEPRLSTLAIVVPPEHRIEGLEIRRAGSLVETGSWDRALPVDGGTYTIVATAPGREAWTLDVSVAVEHDARTVEIPELARKPPPPAPLPLPAVRVAPAVSPPPEHPRSLKVPLLAAGGAAALAATAIGFELWAESTYDASKHEPDNARQHDLWLSANHERYAAEAFGVAALGGLAFAAWWYEWREPSSSATALRVAPSPHGVAVFGRF